MPVKVYSYHHLYSFCKSVFEKLGCSEHDAELATKVLLSADLRGVDSHGVARLSGYVRLWEANRANMQPCIKVIHESPSTGVVDGDGGLGLVVAPFAMELAIQKSPGGRNGMGECSKFKSFWNSCISCDDGPGT